MVKVNNVPSNNSLVFTVPPPAVTTMSPSGGVVGTPITVNGSGFQPNQRDSTLTVNGVAARVSSWNDSQIIATVPGGASTGPLLVTVNGISSSAGNMFVVPNMAISGLSPAAGPHLGTLIINGSGFGATRGQSQVNFNGAPLSGGYLSWSDTSISLTIPDGSNTGPVPVTVSDFNYTSKAMTFTFEGPATVASVSPTIGTVGTSVTLSGSGFGAAQSNSTVQFFPGATATISSWSDTQIVASVPAGAPVLLLSGPRSHTR